MKAAASQVNVGDDPQENMRQVEVSLETCADAELAALPELFAFRGDPARFRELAEPLDGSLVTKLCTLAKRHACWLLAGSILERDADSVFNTSVLISDQGRVTATYRKMHLFDVNFDHDFKIRESDACAPGSDITLTAIAGWPAGLSICYDLRFPELYRQYAARGAELLMVPSNFTHRTGAAHWQTLLRARAIENQCVVIAPNQCGRNPHTGVMSYGHSMIIDPWGCILAEADENPGVVSADLDRTRLLEVRKQLPALRHRRF